MKKGSLWKSRGRGHCQGTYIASHVECHLFENCITLWTQKKKLFLSRLCAKCIYKRILKQENSQCACSHICVFANSVLKQMFVGGVCMHDAEQKENPDWRGHTKVMHRRGGTFLSSAPGILKSAKFGIVRKLWERSVSEQ